jgi:hypothetical protein
MSSGGKAVPNRPSTLALSLLLGTALVLGGLPAARADDTSTALVLHPGSVHGTIVDLDGKTPVEGAKVVLLPKDGGSSKEAVTDKDGGFRIDDERKGEYVIKVGDISGKLLLDDGARATALRLVLEKRVALGGAPAAPAENPKSDGDGISVGLIVAGIVAAAVVVAGLITLQATNNFFDHAGTHRFNPAPTSELQDLGPPKR